MAPHARITARLNERNSSSDTPSAGGRLPTGGARRTPTSPDTLLRRVKSTCPTQPSKVRVLGVDDWSLEKRGQPLRHDPLRPERRVVDLLPSAIHRTFASRLKLHPEVEIISRDRGEEYTKRHPGAPRSGPGRRSLAPPGQPPRGVDAGRRPVPCRSRRWPPRWRRHRRTWAPPGERTGGPATGTPTEDAGIPVRRAKPESDAPAGSSDSRRPQAALPRGRAPGGRSPVGSG